MIAGSILGALIGELVVEKKEFGPAFKSALGAFAGLMAGTGMKLLTSGVMLFYIIF
jgi:uncharacterized protein YqgC (DUF456 family)